MRVEPDGCEVAMAEGLPDEPFSPFQGGRYLGGDLLIDAALGRGGLQLGPVAGSDALAVVPLAIQGVVVGVVVLFELFEHRPPIDDEDREIFDLVAAHAASALLAARAFSTTDRKLRTLQSMVQLIRGGRS
jgi:GAF domain-containing protein